MKYRILWLPEGKPMKLENCEVKDGEEDSDIVSDKADSDCPALWLNEEEWKELVKLVQDECEREKEKA